MGKDINLDSLWSDFDERQAYISKVSQSQLYILRLSFEGPSIRWEFMLRYGLGNEPESNGMVPYVRPDPEAVS
jgi:hypothetical protein